MRQSLKSSDDNYSVIDHTSYANAFNVTTRNARGHSKIDGFPGYPNPRHVFEKWRAATFDHKSVPKFANAHGDEDAEIRRQGKRLELQIQADDAALKAMKRRREEGFYVDRDRHVATILGLIKTFRQAMEGMCEAVPANFPEDVAVKMRRLMRSEYDRICEELSRLPGAPIADDPTKHKTKSRAQARRHSAHDL